MGAPAWGTAQPQRAPAVGQAVAAADAREAGSLRVSASTLRRRRRQRAAIRAEAQAGQVQHCAGGGRSCGIGSSAAVAGEGTAGGVSTSDATVASVGSTDPLVLAAIATEIDAGGQGIVTAVARLRGSVWHLAMDAQGCRIVQSALQAASRQDAAALAAELQGHIREAIASPHANYVVQKVVEALPVAAAGFVAGELDGMGAAVARHRYGCRVMCRLLEHCSGDGRTAALVEEVLEEAHDLSRHSYAHHVVESVLEHGDALQRRRVAIALRGDLLRGSRNRHASYVIEKALTHCAEEDQRALMQELLASPSAFAALAQCQFGGYVVRAVLRRHATALQVVLEQLQQDVQELRATKHGLRLLAELTPGAATVAAPSGGA